MRLQNLSGRMVISLLTIVLMAGCGTTKSRQATEQLLMSDAVDRSVGNLDFSVLEGKTVYLDTQYIQPIKGVGFVNADYIISSLRQQLIAAHCRLQDKQEDASIIVEARVGALGTDLHNVLVGLPATNALSSASSVVPGTPAIPPLPELSLVTKDDQKGAAKIAVFAYRRESREPVWQSGVEANHSEASDTWVFGAGPFQRGNIREGTRFAGSSIPFISKDKGKDQKNAAAMATYNREIIYNELHKGKPRTSAERPTVMQASAEVDDPEPRKKQEAKDDAETNDQTEASTEQ